MRVKSLTKLQSPGILTQTAEHCVVRTTLNKWRSPFYLPQEEPPQRSPRGTRNINQQTHYIVISGWCGFTSAQLLNPPPENSDASRAKTSGTVTSGTEGYRFNTDSYNKPNSGTSPRILPLDLTPRAEGRGGWTRLNAHGKGVEDPLRSTVNDAMCSHTSVGIP